MNIVFIQKSGMTSRSLNCSLEEAIERALDWANFIENIEEIRIWDNNRNLMWSR